MTSLHALEKLLAAGLSALTEVADQCNGRVFAQRVPQGEQLPSIVFNIVDSEDYTTQMIHRGAELYLVSIDVWDAGESKQLCHEVYNDVDGYLQSARIEQDGWLFDCSRVSARTDSAVDKGDVSVVVGGLYHVWVRPLVDD